MNKYKRTWLVFLKIMSVYYKKTLYCEYQQANISKDTAAVLKNCTFSLIHFAAKKLMGLK